MLPLLTDEELEQYIPLRGQRVLARNFCTNSSSNTLAKAPNLVENLQEDTPSPLPSLCNDNLQRKADAIAKVREKLSAGSKKTGKKSSELGSKHKNIRKERTVEIGWSHFNSRERRYAQVRQPCGGGTRHPKMLKSSTKTDILKEAVELFKPLVSETDMDLDISFDVSGQMIMGNDETIGELYEKTKLRYLRFYLISKYKNDSDYDSSLPDIPVINLPGALIAADISSAVTIPVSSNTQSSTSTCLPHTFNTAGSSCAATIPVSSNIQAGLPNTLSGVDCSSATTSTMSSATQSAMLTCVPITADNSSAAISLSTTVTPVAHNLYVNGAAMFPASLNTQSPILAHLPVTQADNVMNPVFNTQSALTPLLHNPIVNEGAPMSDSDTSPTLSASNPSGNINLSVANGTESLNDVIDLSADEQLFGFVDMGTPSVQCRVASDHILTLSDAFLELEKLTKLKRGDRVNIVNVTRDNVMDGGFRAFRRKHFDPNDRLHVKFAGEQGIDEGGPSREFLELMFVAIRKRYFYGEDQNMHLRLDATGGYYRKKNSQLWEVLIRN